MVRFTFLLRFKVGAYRLQTAARLVNIHTFHMMELAKQAHELELAGRSVIHMGIGEPGFTAAEPVMQAAADAMRRSVTWYTGALGIRPLHQAIARCYHTVYGLDIAPGCIIVTAGTSAALLLVYVMLAEIDGGVLVPDPSYPCNRHFVDTFNDEARLVPSGPDEHFQLTVAQVDAHRGDRTQGVLLASLSNPTDTSVLPDELQHIVQTVRVRGGFSIVDEIYQGLSYDQAPVSTLSFGDDVVTTNSFSKYFNMTGWQLGQLMAPAGLAPESEKVAQNLFICVSAVAQYVALACFESETLVIYEERRAEFRRRRGFIVPALESLGFRIPVKPNGAFYVYADCRGVNHPRVDDADALIQSMLHDASVMLVPGLDFGPHTARYYIRLSYTTSMAHLEEVVARLGKLFD